jgi:hypothetical protein
MVTRPGDTNITKMCLLSKQEKKGGKLQHRHEAIFLLGLAASGILDSVRQGPSQHSNAEGRGYWSFAQRR